MISWVVNFEISFIAGGFSAGFLVVVTFEVEGFFVVVTFEVEGFLVVVVVFEVDGILVVVTFEVEVLPEEVVVVLSIAVVVCEISVVVAGISVVVVKISSSLLGDAVTVVVTVVVVEEVTVFEGASLSAHPVQPVRQLATITSAAAVENNLLNFIIFFLSL